MTDPSETTDDYDVDDEPIKCPHGVMEWEDGCFECIIAAKDQEIKELKTQLDLVYENGTHRIEWAPILGTGRLVCDYEKELKSHHCDGCDGSDGE